MAEEITNNISPESRYGETYDVEGVKKALEKVRNDPKLSERFSEAGLQRAEDMYENGGLADLIPSGSKVLDAGHGVGYLGQKIMEGTNSSVTALDLYDIRMTGETPRKLMDFLRGNARQLPIKSGSMDVVILSDILHHTLNPDELIAEAFRVVKEDDGKVIIFEDTVPEKENPVKRKLVDGATRWMDDVFNQQPKGVNPHNYHSVNEWKDTVGKIKPNATVDHKTWYWGPRDFLPGPMKPGKIEKPAPDRFFESTRFVVQTAKKE